MTIATPEENSTPETTTTTTTPPTTAPAPAPEPLERSKDVILTTRTEFPAVQAGQSSVQEIIALAHLEGAEMDNVTDRTKPLRLSAVIDASGSMRGEKLRLAKESLRFMVAELTDKDEFGIVVFESSVHIALEVMKMDEHGKTMALAAIDRIREMGCTNLSGGLFQGIDQVMGKKTSVDPHNLYESNAGWSRRAQVQQPVILEPTRTMPEKYEMTIKHQHSVVKRDGVTKHCYWLQITFDPSAVKPIGPITVDTSSGAKQQGTDVTFDPQDDIIRGFMIGGKGLGGVTVNYILPDPTADEGKQTFEVCGGVATAKNSSEEKKDDESAKTIAAKDDDSQKLDTNDNDAEAPPAATATAKPTKTETACRAVMLFTDGQANGGITDTEQLVAETQRRLNNTDAMDITVYTFGFGESHNSNMLRRISEVTQGSYYFIENTECMQEAFADCLGGLVSIVATDITVTITVPEEYGSIVRVMTQFPTTGTGSQRTVTLKDLFASEQRDLLVKINANTDLVEEEKINLAQFAIHYNNSLTSSKVDTEAVAQIAVTKEKCDGKVDEHVDEQRNRVEIAEAMIAAREAADRNDRERAKTIMSTMQQKVATSATANTESMAMMQDQITETLTCMNDAQTWSSEGTKRMSSYAMQHMQQRCAQPSSTSGTAWTFDAMYANKAKREMRKK